jgi:4-amino-4-deoxy-L-arabinose transferase-like glycosyltransferase
MIELHKNKTLLWSLALAFILVSLYVLGVRTLVPPDEGRYAEMAREMFTSGDWITTRLNGIKYFEKPPLQTWMNALTFAVFGLGDWQARLWTGLNGIFGVLLTGYAGYRVFGQRAGFYAALVLGSCFSWVACSQINSLDMSLSGMMTLSLCALLVAQRDDASPTERRNWMLVCWAGMALAVLAKGLIGLVLPGGILVFYTIFSRDWSIWTRLLPDRRALVRAGRPGQPGAAAFLLHPRAFRPLPAQGTPPRSCVVDLLCAAGGRQRALGRGAGPGPAAGRQA